jgi:predicted alpha/beta superfamily hydrolase
MKKLHFYFTATFFVFALFTCQSVFSQVKDNLIERLYPSDNQFYVDVTDSLVMELSRPVEAISGNLYLYNQLNFVVDTIPLDGPQVTISGDTMLTIVPTNFLYQHWSYYVLTDQGIFGDDYPGIRDPHAWNFTPGFYSRETMYSEFMDDEYLIFISVPDDYDPNRETPYPAIYFTDGNAPRTYQRVNQNYYEGLTLAAISIGVGYHEGENDNRMRDMSLSAYADDFWSFFLKELIPYIEDQYHIDTTNRTYCGGSLGGSFGFYGFCQYKDQENRTFRNYVCGDPSLFDQDSDGNSFEDYESEMHAGIDSLGINLFITAAESEGNRATVSPMIETLKTRDYKNFGLYTWIIPNTNHGSACSRTTEEGILWALTNPEEDYHHPQPESVADAQQVEYSPVTEASPDTILASEIEALDMVENCYNIHKLALFGNSFQLIYNGLDDRLLNEYIAYDNYLIRSDDQYGHHIYERLFAGFNICNKALAGLPYAPVEPDMQSRLIGEVKFCRALLGFYALNIFKHFPFPENDSI